MRVWLFLIIVILGAVLMFVRRISIRFDVGVKQLVVPSPAI